ncbi:MAG: cytochrome-c peroxidase [Flavobacteriaceae bacterium]|jgi:cytochrome c peroxidase|nr:cytochrome-c peroxidase [Flavobacteriaceae bacterium]
MQHTYRIALFLLLICNLWGCKDKNNTYQNITFNNVLLGKVDTLEIRIDQMVDLIAKKQDSAAIREAFVNSRLAYKEMEWAVSYFLPHTSKSINGPALDQLDLDENKFVPAQGFQVVEEFLYPIYQMDERDDLLMETKRLKNFANSIRKNFEVITMSDAQVLEALKLEIFQITALGITGFDTPASKLQFVEATASLKGVKEVIATHKEWSKTNKFQELLNQFDQAIAICKENPSKESFDYLTFITEHLEVLSNGIVALQKELGVAFNKDIQVVKADASSLFDKDLINLNAFMPDSTYYSTAKKIALGKELFFERQLSKDNFRSCADCHHKEKGYSDGLKTALDLKGKPLQRNTPSLNYAAYYHGQFWDMRSVTLESQSSDVITNKDEMHGNLEDIVAHLNSTDKYRKQFEKVYNRKEAIEVWQLENALAAYIRSLATFNSRFDEYMRGNKKTLTEQEKKGFNLFVGKGQCATCHFMPLFNGTVPPQFTNSEQEVLGVPQDKEGTILDSDLGRYIYNTDLAQLKHSFKTPTVRNIGESEPYMHNGVYSTLDEVMDFYNKGGGLGLGLKVESQTLPEDPLNLTTQEMQDIIAFMKALSDK